MREHNKLQKEIETPVLLACAIEVSTGIFGISGGGFEHPKPPLPLGTPLPYVELFRSAPYSRTPSSCVLAGDQVACHHKTTVAILCN